ncbi:MAG: ABC transporter ATP-binding protein [Candidatus Cloacimonetes bacterium]|nr:ABC transporter ATP-binding protein [Candidatus Cloacimonadota bacterium]
MRQQMIGTEDDIKSRIYDKELFKRLISYLKPYLTMVVISFILLMLVAATQLALPYVSKQAVDNVIAANRNLVEFSFPEERDEFIRNYPRIKFLPYEWNGYFFLLFPERKSSFLAREELEKLQTEGRFFHRVVLIDASSGNLDKLTASESKRLSSGIMAVPAAELNRLQAEGALSAEEMKSLRMKDFRQLKIYGLLFLGIILAQFVFTYFQIYTINYSAQHAMYDLRRDLFAHLQKMSLSFFDHNPIGRLVTRVTNDVRTLDEMLSSGLINLIQDLIVMLGILVMMLILDWKLALATFTVLPFLAVLLIVFKNKIRVAYRVVRKKIAAINATLSEDIAGAKIIQLFNQYRRKRDEFSAINEEYYQASLRQMRIYASFRPVIHSMRRVAVAIIVWYGLGRVMQNAISLGIFMAFVSYIDRFFEPIDQLSEKFNILQAAMSGAERIFDLMDKPEEDNYREKKCGIRFRGEIEFQNVSMRYGENNGDVLKNISFRIKPGEKVALVGHTGSGKTSIISLISGLYPFQQGNILIDKQDIRDYCLEELRSNIGIVQQDVFLFTGTIRDNIVLHNQQISQKTLEEVARYVNVHEFIESLPGKYEEPVMERGATLSVGQRQLIAFARVLAYDPAIFVLDEATSNIDTETEILIQDALHKVMEKRTSIIIAHRLSTIQRVDRIIVIHKGEIREEGTHQELLARKGLYFDLYRLQYT